MSGKLKTRGNMMLATKLEVVLKVNYREFPTIPWYRRAHCCFFLGHRCESKALSSGLASIRGFNAPPFNPDSGRCPSVVYTPILVTFREVIEWRGMHCRTTTK